MKWSTVAAALVVAAAPLAFQSPASAGNDEGKRNITLRGCVVPGEHKGTFALTQVAELTAPGQYGMPEMAHGRRVVYWLKEIKNLKPHAGHMIEISGKLDKFKESEAELKRHHKTGELYVEFNGPGKDVKVPNSQVGATIGTAGRVEKDAIKTMLAVIDVKNVTKLSDSCSY